MPMHPDSDSGLVPHPRGIRHHIRKQLQRVVAAGTPNLGPARALPEGDRAAGWRLIDPQYPEILEALPVAVYATDAQGWITFYNEAAAMLWGRHPVLGRDRWCGSWRIYRIDGTPLPHDRCPMAIALRENRPVRNVDAVAERPDGARIHFMPYPTPLRDAHDVLIGAVNILVDLGSLRGRTIPDC
jgi:PAS domain-containing protein